MSIQEIVSKMEAAEETANLKSLPDCLAAADAMVDSLHKALRTTNNPDTLTFISSVKAPMALNSVLLRQNRELSPNITEIAQLHMINPVLSAIDLSVTSTFARKLAKYVGTVVSKTRDSVFRCVTSWWNNPYTAFITWRPEHCCSSS
ncbi:hypothetical protein Plhal703r1_c61g0165691 [Plasmopara halstedii]